MIEVKIERGRLWDAYAAAGYSLSGYIGFRAFANATIPEARVSGNTRDGITLKFKDDVAYTMFALRWL